MIIPMLVIRRSWEKNPNELEYAGKATKYLSQCIDGTEDSSIVSS